MVRVSFVATTDDRGDTWRLLLSRYLLDVDSIFRGRLIVLSPSASVSVGRNVWEDTPEMVVVSFVTDFCKLVLGASSISIGFRELPCLSGKPDTISYNTLAKMHETKTPDLTFTLYHLSSIDVQVWKTFKTSS